MFATAVLLTLSTKTAVAIPRIILYNVADSEYRCPVRRTGAAPGYCVGLLPPASLAGDNQSYAVPCQLGGASRRRKCPCKRGREAPGPGHAPRSKTRGLQL